MAAVLGNYHDCRLGHISQVLAPLITQVRPVDVAHIRCACVIVLLLIYVLMHEFVVSVLMFI